MTLGIDGMRSMVDEKVGSMLTVKLAGDAETVQAVQTLWAEYWKGLGLPGDFQGFEEELRTLPGKYGVSTGALAIAYVDGSPAGTVALRPLNRDACELKRLFVRPQFRRRGVARGLMEWIIERARLLGYRTAYGDTLPIMNDAIELYYDFGFRVIDHPYSNDHSPGAIYFELRI
jgi:GNAT superfamily N-acetyltransferase